MGRYAFLSTWCLREVTLPDAFERLRNSLEYPLWWRGVRSATPQDGGVELHWRGTLPYTLRTRLELTRIEPPFLIEARASGDLCGTGRWRLYEGDGVAVVLEWRVHTTKRWMNVVEPVARPAFVWNHDRLMRRGAHGLAGTLRGALVAAS